MNVGLHSINYLSLCAGGGGLDLGFEMAVEGSKPVCYVENEAFAIQVLVARMEEGWLGKAPIWSDLRTFDGKPWNGIVQAIIGGYPCQPWSLCGKRLGKKDPRHLWPHIGGRLIPEIQPDYCFFENVEGHLSLGFRDVRDELRALGYRVKAGLFSAAEVGASHIRKRLFILAAHERVLADPKGDLGRPELEAQGAGSGRPGLAGEGPILADAAGLRGPEDLRFKSDGVLSALGSNVLLAERSRVPLFPPRPDETEGWRGLLVEEPQLEPAICNMVDESTPRLVESDEASRICQLRLLGNGVVPSCAAFAFSVLIGEMTDDPDA